ncbi:unnamed protein product [Vitrella brassicaformis CCMP3155]|uniref:Galactosylgalactosylxylosylprotein 3-beta-glucuronosyltransferase n=1 Tax=Vitrella brassicaformis (strain CCMP3155) TaxID=1169540 RepID=A0A0G4G5I9_VITBC|nr:unnamed protein product [Vitrella brassicaformis CCMP3155]|eukprot:CEM23322.1 unnamed protein product [Vitrella brassicaformis CCMP3155]
MITPTYRRVTQRLDLVRLTNSLGHVENVHFVLVEDSHQITPRIQQLLDASPVLHWSHLHFSTTGQYHVKGAEQRNTGLDHIRGMISSEIDADLRRAYEAGVVYFADESNAYDLKLFAEIRKVKRIGVWPVGAVSGLPFQHCVVSPNTGKIKGYVAESLNPFPMDTAGFGIHVKSILTHSRDEPRWNKHAEADMAITDFLQQFGLPLEELEPLGSNCTEVHRVDELLQILVHCAGARMEGAY